MRRNAKIHLQEVQGLQANVQTCHLVGAAHSDEKWRGTCRQKEGLNLLHRSRSVQGEVEQLLGLGWQRWLLVQRSRYLD